jgi:hypothetical protein
MSISSRDANLLRRAQAERGRIHLQLLQEAIKGIEDLEARKTLTKESMQTRIGGTT